MMKLFPTDKNKEQFASILVSPADDALLEQVQAYIKQQDKTALNMSVSLMDDVLVCRGMENDIETLRRMLFSLMQQAHMQATSKAA